MNNTLIQILTPSATSLRLRMVSVPDIRPNRWPQFNEIRQHCAEITKVDNSIPYILLQTGLVLHPILVNNTFQSQDHVLDCCQHIQHTADILVCLPETLYENIVVEALHKQNLSTIATIVSQSLEQRWSTTNNRQRQLLGTETIDNPSQRYKLRFRHRKIH